MEDDDIVAIAEEVQEIKKEYIAEGNIPEAKIKKNKKNINKDIPEAVPLQGYVAADKNIPEVQGEYCEDEQNIKGEDNSDFEDNIHLYPIMPIVEGKKDKTKAKQCNCYASRLFPHRKSECMKRKVSESVVSNIENASDTTLVAGGAVAATTVFAGAALASYAVTSALRK